jgi:hypothetical protein
MSVLPIEKHMNTPEKIMLWPEGVPFSENGDGFQPYMESFLLKTPTPSGAIIVLSTTVIGLKFFSLSPL